MALFACSWFPPKARMELLNASNIRTARGKSLVIELIIVTDCMASFNVVGNPRIRLSKSAIEESIVFVSKLMAWKVRFAFAIVSIRLIAPLNELSIVFINPLVKRYKLEYPIP